MCGSSPLPDAVTRSTGTDAVLPGSAARNASMRCLTASVSALLVGPRLEPVDAALLSANGAVADGRLQKYFGSENGWPISSEPSGLSSRSIRLPLAACGNSDLREAGHDQRVDDAGQCGQQRKHDDRLADDLAHDGNSRLTLKAVAPASAETRFVRSVAKADSGLHRNDGVERFVFGVPLGSPALSERPLQHDETARAADVPRIAGVR